MTSSLPDEAIRDSAASSQTDDSVPKLIFVCDWIKVGNESVPEYQRAKMLSHNFRTAIVYRYEIPDSIREVCQGTYRVRGGMLAVLHGFLIIMYLNLGRGYKIVHTGPNIFGLAWGWLAKSLFGCRWVFDLWDHPSLELASANTLSASIKKPLYKLFLRKRLADADAWIIAMHKSVLDHLPKPYPKSKIVHVTNGIDLTSIEPIRKHEARTHEDRDGTVLKVGYVGGISKWRGMGILSECLESWTTEYSISVDLVGKCLGLGGDEEVLSALQNLNHSSPHTVRHHGYLPHKEALVKMAETEVGLCILEPSVLSYDYAYSVKVFEYLALGKVIVASRTPAHSEIISDGDNGFLISFCAEELKGVFDTIVEMKKRGQLGSVRSMARETAELFSWEVINEKILSHLQVTVSGKD